MKIRTQLLMVGFLVLCVFFFRSRAFAEQNIVVENNTQASVLSSADIDVYVREGCPHCAKAEQFLQILQHEQPTLKIYIHDVVKEPKALEKLEQLAKKQALGAVRVPAFYIAGQLLVGYSDEITTGQLIRNNLLQGQAQKKQDASGSCEAKESLSCESGAAVLTQPSSVFFLDFFGYKLSLETLGLPLFTLAMGLLDGFNPCSMWVLILMISLLSPMKNRWRMFAIAGTFIAVEGLAYFMFMSAWLNLFLFIGLSHVAEIIIAAIALFAGLLNLKDFWFYGRVISLSIPNAAKPDIYARMRTVLQAQNLAGALLGTVVLAVLVQMVEFMCTSGFPALYTKILTLKQLSSTRYYGYLLLYNLAYLFDDFFILGIGIVTLSQRRLQEKEGRWLKLISGLVMVGLAIYLFVFLGNSQ
jgi:glutaredoxin